MSTKTAAVRETFALTLDPSVSLQDQIRRGKYDYIYEHYTAKNFRLTRNGDREVVLFDPNGSVSSEQMMHRMNLECFVPATLDDALAMGAQFPDRQKHNPIVFLGTIFRGPGGFRGVPVLNRWGDGRGLYLYWFGRDWCGDYRFAAVPGW